MRTLFVTPCEASAGEAVTAVCLAQGLVAQGAEVRFLASPFTAALVEGALPGCARSLGDDRQANLALWQATLDDFAPDAIVFADWAQLFFISGAAPLASAEWTDSLSRSGVRPIALDHLGYAEATRPLGFGPPFRRAQEQMVAPPPQMEVWRPCPVASAHDRARRGIPFRYWDPPPVSEAERAALRARFLTRPGERLVLHAAPSWAVLWAQGLGHPYYQLLPEVLGHHFRGLGPTLILSIQGNSEVASIDRGEVRFLRLPGVAKADFERLIAAADLFLTENAISVSLGKAILHGTPGALLYGDRLRAAYPPPLDALATAVEAACPGGVFPFEVFPIFGPEDVANLELYRPPSMADAFARADWLGPDTRDRLAALLGGDAALAAAAEVYRRGVASLPHGVGLLLERR